MLGRAMDPYIGNQRDCRCPHCLRKGERNWKNIPNPLWVSRRSRTMHLDGCESMMCRDPLMREPFCSCGNCSWVGDRTVYRDHCRMYDKRMHLMSGMRGGFWPNVLQHWYNDTDSFYGNRYGIRNNKWPRYSLRLESECELEPEPEPCPVGAGLHNLGNTCFLNSIMQCFTHTVVLVQGLLSLKHDTSSHDVGEFCVLCAVRDQIERSLAKSGWVISPSNLVDNLSNISSFFRRDQQEDAHEFLKVLLDKLDCSWSKYEAIAIDAVDPSSPSDSLVQQIFGGRFVSQICCCKCGHSSETPEPLLDLSLEIGEEDSLESALKSFTKVETLEGTNMFSCGNCKELVKAEKQLLLDNAPMVAALHLKRFKNDGVNIEKIDKMVEYPLELDLTPYTKGSNGENGDLKYELFAFVVHVGFSATSGHYFCYIRTSPEDWYQFDDSKVSRVPEDIALRQDAYILFYTKKGTPWFSTLLDKWKQEYTLRDRYGSSQRDDSGDASVLPSSVEKGGAEIADTQLIMEESGANKHEMCSKTIGSMDWAALDTKVALIFVKKDGDVKHSTGTIIYSDPQHVLILTCGHSLIPYFVDSPNIKIEVFLGDGCHEFYDSFEAEVLSNLLHAYCETGLLFGYVNPVHVSKRGVAPITSEYEIGQDVYLSSLAKYPHRKLHTSGMLSSDRLPGASIDLPVAWVFEHTLETLRGSSGGGVMDRDGRLIGVLICKLLETCVYPEIQGLDISFCSGISCSVASTFILRMISDVAIELGIVGEANQHNVSSLLERIVQQKIRCGLVAFSAPNLYGTLGFQFPTSDDILEDIFEVDDLFKSPR